MPKKKAQHNYRLEHRHIVVLLVFLFTLIVFSRSKKNKGEKKEIVEEAEVQWDERLSFLAFRQCLLFRRLDYFPMSCWASQMRVRERERHRYEWTSGIISYIIRWKIDRFSGRTNFTLGSFKKSFLSSVCGSLILLCLFFFSWENTSACYGEV